MTRPIYSKLTSGILSYLKSYGFNLTAHTAYTPVFSSAGGAVVTTAALQGNYYRIGRLVFLRIRHTFTYVSGTGEAQYSLPFPTTEWVFVGNCTRFSGVSGRTYPPCDINTTPEHGEKAVVGANITTDTGTHEYNITIAYIIG